MFTGRAKHSMSARAGLEETQIVLVAPGCVLAQIQFVLRKKLGPRSSVIETVR